MLWCCVCGLQLAVHGVVLGLAVVRCVDSNLLCAALPRLVRYNVRMNNVMASWCDPRLPACHACVMLQHQACAMLQHAPVPC